MKSSQIESKQHLEVFSNAIPGGLVSMRPSLDVEIEVYSMTMSNKVMKGLSSIHAGSFTDSIHAATSSNKGHNRL